VDKFLSTIMLIYILTSEFLICVPLYQLVLVSKNPTIFTAIPNRHTTQFAHFPLTPLSRIPLHEALSSIVKNSYRTVVTTPTELSLFYCLIFPKYNYRARQIRRFYPERYVKESLVLLVSDSNFLFILDFCLTVHHQLGKAIQMNQPDATVIY